MIIAYEVINGPYMKNTYLKVWEHLAKNGLELGLKNYKKVLKIPEFRELYSGRDLHIGLNEVRIVKNLDEIGEEANNILSNRPIPIMTLKAMTLRCAEICRGNQGADECLLWFGMHSKLFYKNVK
jgi:hypothetical protein